ncbi:hypothetical protein DFQ28_011027 [Apophysomyces sp. BC1034]|nr:hypothetical protein DFQ30_010815 [Apophysomyces sp. BC1015]KAG0184500.1 hypothetical protein DFQ28_011027 [Apophysomyces sp. BC1034]
MGDMMQVAKWGNSLAVRLPASLVEVLKIREGDDIEIVVDGPHTFAIRKKPGVEALLERLRTFREDADKADNAEALLKCQPVISVQVLNEVTSVCRRKLAMDWEDIGKFLDLIRRFCSVMPLTIDVHDRARQIAQRHQLAFYDACIVAAAAVAGCQTLYSEDMSHGQIFEDGLMIKNPFIYNGISSEH